MDGYLGFPLAQHLLNRRHDIFGIDCFYRRKWVEEVGSQSVIPIADWGEREKTLKTEFDGEFQGFKRLDVAKNYQGLEEIIRSFNPSVIVHLGQQPSPAYSMKSPRHATFTQANNVCGGLNLLWAVKKVNHEIPIVTLGTMGEYSCPNMPIPEGFFKCQYEGMEDILPFPRQGHSVYHVSKIQTTENVWFACRTWVMKVTDVHQGVVYGTKTDEMRDDYRRRTRFDIDECFGTAINRFVACAVSGHPIVIYGSGYQTRGYITLRDSIQCITLVVEKPPTYDDSFHGHRILNQFDEAYSINQLAGTVKKVGEKEFGLDVKVENIENPRIEPEVHYYNPQHEKLKRLGFRPTKTLEGELKIMFEDVLKHTNHINVSKIRPKIRWRDKR